MKIKRIATASGTPRKAVAAAAAVAVTTGLTLGIAPAAQADSIGKYIDLSSGTVTFNQATPHTWASTTVHLNWQADGNLVLYCNGSDKVLWATNTVYTGDFTNYLVFGGGEIQIDDPDLSPIWHESGEDSVNDYAYVQNDGNFVIYAPNGTPEWATGTENKC